MQELDDIALLRQYAEQNSEEAFAALVTRHIDKVYSVALRHTGNPHQAEEITQAVFVILARKSSDLSKHVILEGWLYETARLTAMTFIRSEIRRARREQEAYVQNVLNENEADVWPQIVPLLDSGLAGLNETDRHAVVLRFFYGKSMREIGTALGGSEDTARMRINRTLEKLRKFFVKRGIASTPATLAGAISANSVQAAPVTLAKIVTAVAITKDAMASASTLTLIKGALKIMAWTKAKTHMTAAIVIVCIATTTTLVIQHQPHLPKPQPVSSAETDFPKSSWVFAGYADPQSALVSSLWAQTKSDNRTFLTSLSPEAKQKRQQEFNDRMIRTGKTAAELFAQDSRNLDKTTGFRIIGQEIDAGNGILLHLYVQGNEMNIDAKMVKIGNEWKFDDFINQKPVAPNKRP
jgi:RNA polymerase sigma factor (sigma-70 family)